MPRGHHVSPIGAFGADEQSSTSRTSTRKRAISVKLVSEVGVGTVAAGVAKARADHVTISGYEGGTGASPLTSLTHAGAPWEIGLAETQQTLVPIGCARASRCRSMAACAPAAMWWSGRLGADEMGFSTAPLIAAGCIMMRKCHLNTCPVGVATQDPVLRKRFKGLPEHVINYFFFLAEDVRRAMAAIGFRRFADMVGATRMAGEGARRSAIGREAGFDFRRLFQRPAPARTAWPSGTRAPEPPARHGPRPHPHPCGGAVSGEADAGRCSRRPSATSTAPSAPCCRATSPSATAMPACRRTPSRVKLTGTAGQSFGAFLAHGITLELLGDANDYVGKGLSGGRVIVRPPAGSTRVREQHHRRQHRALRRDRR